MRKGFIVVAALLVLAPVARAQHYAVDPAHAGVNFRVTHVGLSWTFGRFNDVSGEFTVDGANSTFALTIKADSVDTGNKQRDGHLCSPDFFNVKQFPQITFKSTAVKPVEGGLDVTGDFTMHGVTKPMTFTLKGGNTAELPKGVKRTGYTTELVLKRSEYGMDKMIPGAGDDVHVAISFEGTAK
ncbi:MAG: YceI family protein [Gemmataceae bacterium]